MSLLSDFFIATPVETAVLNSDSSPALYLPSMLARGVGVVELKVLAGLLLGSLGGEPPYDCGWPPPGVAEDEARVLPLPGVVADVLAWAREPLLEALAGDWAHALGWSTEGDAADAVASFLGELAAMARDAKATGRAVYVWLCECP